MELLVRIVDKGPHDNQSKAGDVIAICPDGWEWSQAERTNPDWIIIHADLTEIESNALQSAHLKYEAKRGLRRWKIDTKNLHSGDRLNRAELMEKVNQ